MNADADFLAAIRANPDDDALRLVYADWLEERGDSRGEFLRLDMLLTSESKQNDRLSPEIVRLRELRQILNREWVLSLGRAGFREVEVLELRGDQNYESLANPDWRTVGTEIRRLDGDQYYLTGLLITAAYEQDYFDIGGGHGAFCMVGEIDGHFWQYVDPEKSKQPVNLPGGLFSGRPEQEICYDLETVVRAAKYVYYYREFPPNLPHTNEPP